GPPDKKKGGARFFPQTGLEWRWPFINSYCQNQSVVLQPVGQLIAAPDTPIGIKSRRIPNEDSADFEFNDANLFSPDRFPGDYVFINKHAGTPDKKDFNQISFTFSSQFTKYWSLIGLVRQNVRKKKDGGGPLERGIGLIYRDDCFGLGLTIKRQYYRTTDL